MDMLGLPTDGMVGKSLLPVLKGETAAHRDAVMVTYNGQQFGLFSQRMLRMGDIKYTWNLTDTDELYDLASDPYELHNFISDPAYAETLQSMRHRLLAELQAENDCMLNSWTEQQLRLGRKL
jgi:arylsulfatase A-like enzyme